MVACVFWMVSRVLFEVARVLLVLRVCWGNIWPSVLCCFLVSCQGYTVTWMYRVVSGFYDSDVRVLRVVSRGS